MNYFKVKNRKKISELQLGDELPTSDFACIEGGDFIQLELIEDETNMEKYDVSPGLYTIGKQQGKLVLIPTTFSKDPILTTYSHTVTIKSKIDKFFSKLRIYRELGIDPPRRAALLYGPPGVGKTLGLKTASEDYIKDGKTLVVIWATDKYEAYALKEFIKTFNYVNIERMILIAEDIGGVEVENNRMPSDSSLLSLFDNVEKTFSIPTYIIATTNFPEMFLENLTKRPGRIDDLIEVSLPNPIEREALLKYFIPDASQELLDKIRTTKYSKFSAAHIKEVIIRSKLHDLSYQESIDQIASDIERYDNYFTNKKKLGISFD